MISRIPQPALGSVPLTERDPSIPMIDSLLAPGLGRPDGSVSASGSVEVVIRPPASRGVATGSLAVRAVAINASAGDGAESSPDDAQGSRESPDGDEPSPSAGGPPIVPPGGPDLPTGPGDPNDEGGHDEQHGEPPESSESNVGLGVPSGHSAEMSAIFHELGFGGANEGVYPASESPVHGGEASGERTLNTSQGLVGQNPHSVPPPDVRDAAKDDADITTDELSDVQRYHAANESYPGTRFDVTENLNLGYDRDPASIGPDAEPVTGVADDSLSDDEIFGPISDDPVGDILRTIIESPEPGHDNVSTADDIPDELPSRQKGEHVFPELIPDPEVSPRDPKDAQDSGSRISDAVRGRERAEQEPSGAAEPAQASGDGLTIEQARAIVERDGLEALGRADVQKAIKDAGVANETARAVEASTTEPEPSEPPRGLVRRTPGAHLGQFGVPTTPPEEDSAEDTALQIGPEDESLPPDEAMRLDRETSDAMDADQQLSEIQRQLDEADRRLREQGIGPGVPGVDNGGEPHGRDFSTDEPTAPEE